MTKAEFLDTVAAQIRCRKARGMVCRELEQHIQAQALDYEREGMEKEDALEKALADMGDPVEIGVEMDRIHRPRMSWGIVALAGLVSLAGIILQILLQNQTAAIGEIRVSDVQSNYVRTQIGYTVVGFLLMLLVCRVDYSFLGKHAKWIAAAFLLFMYGGTRLAGVEMYGAVRFVNIFGIQISGGILMWLYVPVFAALLYAYRGEGRLAALKLFLWGAAGVCYLAASSLASALLLGLVLSILFSAAVWREWYQVNKGRVLLGVWGVILAVPLILLASACLGGSVLADYQTARLRSFFYQDSVCSYQARMAGEILKDSSLVGGGGENLARAVESLPAFGSDYSFVSLVAACGILAGTAVLVALMLLGGRILFLSLGQRNRLGMMVGSGCGLVLLVWTGWSVLMNLGMIPPASAVLPLVSAGGTGIVTTYLLLGLALSVCRYRNILGEESGKKERAGIGEKKTVFTLRLGEGVLRYER